MNPADNNIAGPGEYKVFSRSPLCWSACFCFDGRRSFCTTNRLLLTYSRKQGSTTLASDPPTIPSFHLELIPVYNSPSIVCIYIRTSEQLWYAGLRYAWLYSPLQPGPPRAATLLVNARRISPAVPVSTTTTNTLFGSRNRVLTRFRIWRVRHRRLLSGGM